jgi:glycosyltransferase involved in cell wall biosynthesis
MITSINTGGAEKFCIDLSNTQSKNSSDEIFLCILDEIKDQPLLKMVSSKVKVISLDKKSGYSIITPFKIYRLFSKIEPDIVHFNGRDMTYASIATIIKSIPSIYTVHSMVDLIPKSMIKYNKFLFNYFPSLFMPISISKSVKKTTQKNYGEPFTEMIYNGSSAIDLSSQRDSVSDFINELKEDENSLVFVYVGRLTEVKNTLLLIESFNRLLDDKYNVCLCIVGYDISKSQSYLKKCQDKNRHPSKIKFVGQKRNIADYFSCADASCVTSNHEGLGITILESFSMGVPVLSTPCGGPPELIESGVTGLVSKEITVESYVEILKNFIDNPIRNKKNIIELYKKNYTMDITSSRYIDVYKKQTSFTEK